MSWPPLWSAMLLRRRRAVRAAELGRSLLLTRQLSWLLLSHILQCRSHLCIHPSRQPSAQRVRAETPLRFVSHLTMIMSLWAPIHSGNYWWGADGLDDYVRRQPTTEVSHNGRGVLPAALDGHVLA